MENKKYAKVFGEDADQIVVMVLRGDDGRPRVNIHFQPRELGVCSLGFPYQDSDEGWDSAEKFFEKLDERLTTKIVNAAYKNF